MIVVNLPTPPSANRIWRSARGNVYRSEVYNAWTKAVGWELKIARAKPIKGPVSVQIAVSDKVRGDLDNRAKPTIDALVTHGVIEGDDKKIVKSIKLSWDASVTGIRVTVSPTL